MVLAFSSTATDLPSTDSMLAVLQQAVADGEFGGNVGLEHGEASCRVKEEETMPVQSSQGSQQEEGGSQGGSIGATQGGGTVHAET